VPWQDFRGADYDNYAQRVSADGSISWITDGVPLCTATGNQSAPGVVSDGMNGAIVAWQDFRSGSSSGDADIYAQRVLFNGTVSWGANGVALCSAPGPQGSASIVSDGATGAIVTWQDYRGPSYDIYAQRILDGVVRWPGDGVALCTAPESQSSPTCVSDGAGGAIVTWQDFRSGIDMHIYAQRISFSGVLSSGNGVALCTAAGGQTSPTIATDGAGGAIITWIDNRSGNSDIYAQRISTVLAPQWAVDGVALCAATGDQAAPVIISDAVGGAVVVWSEGQRTSSEALYARRTPASGLLRTINVEWGSGGKIDLLNSRVTFSGSVMVGESEEAIFQAVPDPGGYFINDITLDGVSRGVIPNLDLSHPTADHTISAVFSNGDWYEPGIQTPMRAYTTLAYPLTFANDSVRAVLDELGPFDDAAWRLARWTPESSTYQFAGQGFHRFETGAGYWLITANGAQVLARTPSV
jgi:hypothetical protein